MVDRAGYECAQMHMPYGPVGIFCHYAASPMRVRLFFFEDLLRCDLGFAVCNPGMAYHSFEVSWMPSLPLLGGHHFRPICLPLPAEPLCGI